RRASPATREHGRQGCRDPVVGPCGDAAAREWSGLRNVARATVTTLWHRGHWGFMLLPAMPSRYESRAWQCGQGPNHAYAMGSPSVVSDSADDQLHTAPDAEHRALAPGDRVLVVAALPTCEVAVHDLATLRAVRHRRVGASMVHVVAGRR